MRNGDFLSDDDDGDDDDNYDNKDNHNKYKHNKDNHNKDISVERYWCSTNTVVFNRPGVAGAVLQKPSPLIKTHIHPL